MSSQWHPKKFKCDSLQGLSHLLQGMETHRNCNNSTRRSLLTCADGLHVARYVRYARHRPLERAATTRTHLAAPALSVRQPHSTTVSSQSWTAAAHLTHPYALITRRPCFSSARSTRAPQFSTTSGRHKTAAAAAAAACVARDSARQSPLAVRPLFLPRRALPSLTHSPCSCSRCGARPGTRGRDERPRTMVSPRAQCSDMTPVCCRCACS